ncbi:hypothetical protein ACFTAO_06595 [Paenibacillus rhizoplanae]
MKFWNLFARPQGDKIEQLLEQSQFVFFQADVKKGSRWHTGGSVAIFHLDQVYMFDAYGPETRSLVQSETETIITGPHDSFCGIRQH